MHKNTRGTSKARDAREVVRGGSGACAVEKKFEPNLKTRTKAATLSWGRVAKDGRGGAV